MSAVAHAFGFNYSESCLTSFERSRKFLRHSERRGVRDEASGRKGSRNSSDRMQGVLALLEQSQFLSVSELAALFGVSEVTIRNDLSVLARDGLVVRTRGGVRSLRRGRSEAGFDVRLRVEERRKRAIARAVAGLVHDGESVALDSSTTAYYVALELREKRELVVVTNGLRAAAALASAPGVSVLIPAGALRFAALSVVGEFTANLLRTTSIGCGFFGARGVSREHGLMDLNPDEVRTKREMVAACKRVVGVFDSTKWHRTALLSFASFDSVDAIVTDREAPADLVDAWQSAGVDVVLASFAGEPANSVLPIARKLAARQSLARTGRG